MNDQEKLQRVREQALELYRDCAGDSCAKSFCKEAGYDCAVCYVNQLFSLPDIGVISDEQTLPPSRYKGEYTTTVVYGNLKEAYFEGQVDVKDAGFVRLIGRGK